MATTSMEKEPQVDSSPPPPKNEEEDAYLTGFALLSVLLSLVLVIFLMMLDTSIVATAIPRITTQFHSLDDVGWYVFDLVIAHHHG
jgi:MFS family permease